MKKKYVEDPIFDINIHVFEKYYKLIRYASGLTTEQLARKLGCCRQTISVMEKNTKNVQKGRKTILIATSVLYLNLIGQNADTKAYLGLGILLHATLFKPEYFITISNDELCIKKICEIAKKYYKNYTNNINKLSKKSDKFINDLLKSHILPADRDVIKDIYFFTDNPYSELKEVGL